ncbi:MAG: class I SAM-dependent methyltransferase [Oligoflexales bacterium]|nr:class I SAM-dependent methyltransferase [Oligoflexales bacterium]
MSIGECTTKNTHQIAANILFSHLKNGRVLDIPSGEGAFAKRCKERGLDIIAGDVENICKVPGIEFAQVDMSKTLSFTDASFDAVVSLDGIEHIERQFDFIRECNRITRRGGQLIVSTPNISSLRSRWRWFLTGFHNKCKVPLDETNPNPWHHISMISLPELRYVLHTNGYLIHTITTNRIKPVSWLYALFIPLAFFSTLRVFHEEEKDKGQRKRNREIFRQLFTRDVLFGETLIVAATKL